MGTYYVALAFRKSIDSGDIVACDPKEARSSEQAIRVAAHWQRWKGIAEPSRFLGRATRRSATLTMR
jgi:hypothetical protein